MYPKVECSGHKWLLNPSGKNFIIIFFTKIKPFSSVPHIHLISKLQGCGISGKLLDFGEEFPYGKGRKQKVITII